MTGSSAAENVEWLPVATMSTVALIAQRTNLAPSRHLARVMERLLDLQNEIDRRLEERR